MDYRQFSIIFNLIPFYVNNIFIIILNIYRNSDFTFAESAHLNLQLILILTSNILAPIVFKSNFPKIFPTWKLAKLFKVDFRINISNVCTYW